MNQHNQTNGVKSTSGKSLFTEIKRFSIYEWMVVISVLLMGLILFDLGLSLAEAGNHFGNTLETFSGVITADIILGFIGHFFQNKRNQKEVSDMMDQKGVVLMKLISKGISEVKNLDCHQEITNIARGFNLKKIFEDALHIENQVYIFQRIYLSEDEFICMSKNLEYLIVRKNHKFIILLHDPRHLTTIRKRLEQFPGERNSLDSEAKIIQDHAEQQMIFFYNLRAKLPTDKWNNLQVKFHDNPRVTSLTGYGDKIVFCPYLNNRKTDVGTHITVKNMDNDYCMYHELMNHFETDWGKGTFYSIIKSKIYVSKALWEMN